MDSTTVIIADIIKILEGHLSAAKSAGNVARATDLTKSIQKLKEIANEQEKTR